MGSVYPREFIIRSNEVVVFCWGTCWGLGVGEHGRGVSHCCMKAPFTSKDATGQQRRVRILGNATPPGLEGEGVSGLQKLRKQQNCKFCSVSGLIYKFGGYPF